MTYKILNIIYKKNLFLLIFFLKVYNIYKTHFIKKNLLINKYIDYFSFIHSFYFILFYFILFYIILFYFILFYFILFYFILFYFILFYFILFYFIFYFVLFYFFIFIYLIFNMYNKILYLIISFSLLKTSFSFFMKN